MDETKEIDIDLRKIIYMMRTKIVFIILITMLFAVVSGLYTHFFITPIYSTNISICIYSDPDRITSDKSITTSELYASRDLVKSYIYILTQDPIMEKVAEEVGINSAGAVKSCITTSQVEETVIFTVTVSHPDPEQAANIANAIAKVAPDEMKRVLNAGDVSVINTAKKPTSPSSPNTKKNIMIGAIAGFIISFAGFFIYEMFDTTITNAKDLERDFELPVLGTVPSLDKVDKKSENDEPDDFDIEIPESSISKPSSQLLENIQSMKGDVTNDKA